MILCPCTGVTLFIGKSGRFPPATFGDWEFCTTRMGLIIGRPCACVIELSVVARPVCEPPGVPERWEFCIRIVRPFRLETERGWLFPSGILWMRVPWPFTRIIFWFGLDGVVSLVTCVDGPLLPGGLGLTSTRWAGGVPGVWDVWKLRRAWLRGWLLAEVGILAIATAWSFVMFVN
jgi:hypothetical protein